jgi:hypothetical protein
LTRETLIDKRVATNPLVGANRPKQINTPPNNDETTTTTLTTPQISSETTSK